MNCIIPARMNSKGLYQKNKKMLCGKPLILWTIEAALKSNCFDKVIVCSDDPDILSLSRGFTDVYVHNRDAEKALDTSPVAETVATLIELYPADNYALLQPTSPLRTNVHIMQACEAFQQRQASSLVSMCEVEVQPALYYVIEDTKIKPLYSHGKKINNRQEVPRIYKVNGAIYLFTREFFHKSSGFIDEGTQIFLMDSACSIDIDSQSDFDAAGMVMQKYLENRQK
jgi:CMP-N,N'-diacetyllegionaminic acid synthase